MNIPEFFLRIRATAARWAARARDGTNENSIARTRSFFAPSATHKLGGSSATQYGALSKTQTRALFVPSVGNFRQGMIVSIPLHLTNLAGKPVAADFEAALVKHYQGSEFVSVVPAEANGKLDAQALNDTNRLDIRVVANNKHGHAVLIARLDNLGKGASGAAVQNLSLMLGLELA